MSQLVEGGDQRQVLAQRIRDARERLGLTQEQLALRAGLPAPQTVSQIERCEREVKVPELVRIAEALHMRTYDLLISPPPATYVLWRNPPSRSRAEVEARFIENCRNYSLAEEWAGVARNPRLEQVPRPEHLDDYDYVERKAEEVREGLRLGRYPALALIQSLEEDLGIKVFFERDLEGSAACARGDFGAAILANASEAPWRRNCSVAHEFFHLLTWETLPPQCLEENPEEWKSAERLANVFASAFLLPVEAVLGRLKERRARGPLQLIDLVELAREFNVSIDALLWRLANLRIFDRERTRKLLANDKLRALDQASLRQYHYAEPEPLPDRLLNLLFTAYAKGDVSAARIAEMTGLSLVDVYRRLSAIDEEAELGQTELGVA